MTPHGGRVVVLDHSRTCTNTDSWKRSGEREKRNKNGAFLTRYWSNINQKHNRLLIGLDLKSASLEFLFLTLHHDKSSNERMLQSFGYKIEMATSLYYGIGR